MGETEFQYDEDLEIDPDSLDVEWLGQAKLYRKYSEELAEAEKRMKRRKEKVETVRADLVLDAHRNGIEGLDKLTEAKVSAWIQLHPKFEEVKEEFFESEYEVSLLKGAVTAISQKKSALENLVTLHGQQYFASPKLPRNLSEEWEMKKQKRVEEGMEKQATKMKKGRIRKDGKKK